MDNSDSGGMTMDKINGEALSLSIHAAANIYAAIRELEHEDIKLAPGVRLKLAINLARLEPAVRAYEVGRAALVRQVFADLGVEASGPEIAVRDAELRQAAAAYELRTITCEDLKLGDNARINPNTIARLAPIIENFDE